MMVNDADISLYVRSNIASVTHTMSGAKGMSESTVRYLRLDGTYLDCNPFLGGCFKPKCRCKSCVSLREWYRATLSEVGHMTSHGNTSKSYQTLKNMRAVRMAWSRFSSVTCLMGEKYDKLMDQTVRWGPDSPMRVRTRVSQKTNSQACIGAGKIHSSSIELTTKRVRCYVRLLCTLHFLSNNIVDTHTLLYHQEHFWLVRVSWEPWPTVYYERCT